MRSGICWTQPPDAENRMSGGVGGLTGAIPLARPDLSLVHDYYTARVLSNDAHLHPAPL